MIPTFTHKGISPQSGMGVPSSLWGGSTGVPPVLLSVPRKSSTRANNPSQQPEPTTRANNPSQQPEPTTEPTTRANNPSQQPEPTTRANNPSQQPEPTTRANNPSQQPEPTTRANNPSQQPEPTTRANNPSQQPEPTTRANNPSQQPEPTTPKKISPTNHQHDGAESIPRSTTSTPHRSHTRPIPKNNVTNFQTPSPFSLVKHLLIFLLLLIPSVASAQETTEEGDPVFNRWKAKIDPAIENSLAYLARVQNEDGSFPESYGKSTGIPALVGMAWLSKGYMPTEGKYSKELNRCIDYIVKHQNKEGLFVAGHAGSGPMYAHNIATLFLSEVSGMVDPVRQEKITPALRKALSLLLRAQAVPKSDRHKGGWRYHPGSRDSDTSCSGWALMALRSAKLNGAPVPDKAIKDAVDYLIRHYDKRDGCFGYTGTSDHKYSLTGMGLLCLELCGRHGSEETIKSADFLLRNYRRIEKNSFEFYGNYYNAQAMFQIGGRHWETYADWMYETYLKRQQADGSWHSREAGKVYGTSIMALAFTVPYRQLPIYQRDETVDEE